MSDPAPQTILEIVTAAPPAPAKNSWGTWAQSDGTFPTHSSNGFEWVQAADPLEEYDRTSIGASGWIVEDPDESNSDFPFDHPFGFSVSDNSSLGFKKPWDWEFQVALDTPYVGLMSPASSLGEDGGELPTIPDSIKPLVVPDAVLGVEIDSALTPQSFKNQVHAGDRIAMYGRWILDVGHEFAVPAVNGKQYRTEIHPPLVLAAGSVQRSGTGPKTTQVVFTSRPFLVGQTYCLDPKNAYKDGVDDDGGFWDHLLKECVKVIGPPVINILGIGESWKVEAHPKIKSHPFQGVHLLHFIVRPPVPAPSTGHGHLGPIDSPLAPKTKLEVSYQFTVRNGCAVQVVSLAQGQIDIFVSLNSVGYKPPKLPKRRDRNYSRAELDGLSKGSGTRILELDALMTALGLLTGGPIDAAKVAAVLSTGIKTDEYEAPQEINVLDAHRAVNTYSDNIPPGKGIAVDDGQPYPVYGWLTAKWVEVRPVNEA